VSARQANSGPSVSPRVSDVPTAQHYPDWWGRIVGPAEENGRWVFEYPGRAWATNVTAAFELFEPTLQQRQQTEPRFAQLASPRA